MQPEARGSHLGPAPLVRHDEIRLAMIGMVEGNGHPYSWSAIFNGFDAEEMARCPYAAIPGYLTKEPPDSVGIDGARVTHVWTDDPSDALRVSRASLIPNVVKRPEDVIGQVDAVIVATDIGSEHVERCRPFVEAGLPVFVDKPLVDNEEDLLTFAAWAGEGKAILSSSAMRYCKEFGPYRESTHDLGTLRYVSITTPKSWERYGIHALEGVYPIVGPGFEAVTNTGTLDRNIVNVEHCSGVDVVIAAISDMYGAFGVLTLCGTAGHAQASASDTYHMFRAQLMEFVTYLRTGVPPFPFEETLELMRVIIAGARSRDEGGRKVRLDEIADGELPGGRWV